MHKITSISSPINEDWKQNQTLRGMATDLLSAVDELSFVSDEGDVVFPDAKQILRALPSGISLSEVEVGLSSLATLGLLGTEHCGCCGKQTYFRVCSSGVPLILHDYMSEGTVN